MSTRAPFDVTSISTIQAGAELRAIMEQKSNGAQMKALNQRKRAKIRGYELTKEVQPATIINFNPVRMTLAGGLPYSVPSCLEQVPEMQILVNARRTKYTGSYLTINSPHYYTKAIGVAVGPNDDLADGLGTYDIADCKPIESAYHLWAAYNAGSQDATNMGGCVAFEGDQHRFRKAIAASKQEGHAESFLRVPRYQTMDDGTRSYYVETAHVLDVLDDEFHRQQLYCELSIQLTQAKYDNEDTRNQITMIDRVWGQFALDMGWKQQAMIWLNAHEDPKDTCVGCGAIRKRRDAHFCGGCNRPYDAFEAFMAGENVAQSFLASLPDEKLVLVRKELRRRRDALDLGKDDDAVIGWQAAQTPQPVAPAQPVVDPNALVSKPIIGAAPKTLDSMDIDELRAEARRYGFTPHHNTKESAIIAKIREEMAKDITSDEDDE